MVGGKTMIIVNGRIYLEDRLIENGYLEIEGTQIVGFGEMSRLGSIPSDAIDAKGDSVIPGFIDQHIHGANGSDHMDASDEALDTITRFIPKEGTTSYLATTMTQSVEAVTTALEAIDSYVERNNKPGQAEILGIHLEGPFISKKHVGAQNPDFVQKPEKKTFDLYWKAAGGRIKLITYAPEEAEEGFTDYLRSKGVVPSAGHTDADYYGIVKEIPHGLSNLTHFHNAMKPHHHREPGAVTAGFINPELKAELIVDGVHLDPAVVKATYEIKGVDNVIAITDAMRAKGLPDGEYDLGGQMVKKVGKECRIDTGALAGSVAEMDFVVRNFKNFTGASMRNLIKISSENSAKHLGVFGRKGSIAIGKDADIIIVSDDIEIKTTVCRGVIAYQKEA